MWSTFVKADVWKDVLSRKGRSRFVQMFERLFECSTAWAWGVHFLLECSKYENYSFACICFNMLFYIHNFRRGRLLTPKTCNCMKKWLWPLVSSMILLVLSQNWIVVSPNENWSVFHRRALFIHFGLFKWQRCADFLERGNRWAEWLTCTFQKDTLKKER